MRKLLLLFVCVCASIGAWAHPIPGGGEVTVENGVATFHNVTAGNINDHWNPVSNHLNGVTRIKFDNTCAINKNDLERFLQGNTYYVDLFDITNGTNTPMKIDDYKTEDDDNDANNIDKIIEAAVQDMVDNSWQAKGIILPLNTGSGTTKVERGINSESKATFTEYVAYYRGGGQKTAAIFSQDNGMNEWRNGRDVGREAQPHFDIAYQHLSQHTEVNDVETFIASTNFMNIGTDDMISLDAITKSGVTKISIINDELAKPSYANEGRSLLTTIKVNSTGAGDFAAAVKNTGIRNTPCEKLIITGPVKDDDLTAINNFDDATIAGPQVVNLAETTGVTANNLKLITNDKVNFVICPNGMDKSVVNDKTFSGLTNLKTALSYSSDKKELTAYVNEAGSLAQARCYASGNNQKAPNYHPKTTGLTKVTYVGSLNNQDINTTNDKGNALANESNTIQVMDLEDAKFATVSHMNFSSQTGGAGFGNSNSIREIKLPNTMEEIPAQCLYGLKLTELHIPYSYKKIGTQAFWQGKINHITTEDANGGLIDNGPNTYSLSANIEELNVADANGQRQNSVFPNQVKVTDVYCLATKAPLCYEHTFPLEVVYNNGGMEGNMVYCREKYRQGENWTALLHFPSLETYVNANGNDTGYNDMVANYTDPTRKYTKKDQTGAVDANGNYLLWPDQKEQMYAHDEHAIKGYTWDQYKGTYETSGDGHMSDMEQIDNTIRPFHGKYNGWHEFVLANATYFEPPQTVDGDKIIEEYQEAGWFTICVPYDLTVEQVINWLGVPSSHDNVICKLYGANGNLIEADVQSPKMPDARQLWSVERLKSGVKNQKGDTYTKNMVYLRFTTNLLSTNEYKYLEFNHANDPGSVIQTITTQTETSGSSTICLKGGRPYIIKAYKRLGETIKSQNIGKLIMTRHGDELLAVNSCVKNADTREWLGDGTRETLKFARPYEKHKVQAFNGNAEIDESESYMTYKDGDKDKKYYYTMIGQFWDQDLPKFCFYMSHGKWYRNSTDNDYKWQAYKCVIIPTVEVEGTKGEGYRDDARSTYPIIVTGDKLDGELKIGFANGRDDDDFGNYTQSKFICVFDDEGVSEFDENGEIVSAIDTLDGEDITVATGNGKVYNMSGQYVGTSLNGLAKGMYIVNGKKFVVK